MRHWVLSKRLTCSNTLFDILTLRVQDVPYVPGLFNGAVSRVALQLLLALKAHGKPTARPSRDGESEDVQRPETRPTPGQQREPWPRQTGRTQPLAMCGGSSCLEKRNAILATLIRLTTSSLCLAASGKPDP